MDQKYAGRRMARRKKCPEGNPRAKNADDKIVYENPPDEKRPWNRMESAVLRRRSAEVKNKKQNEIALLL